MKNKLTALLLLIVLLLVVTTPTLLRAQEDDATSSSPTQESIEKSLQDRIQKALQDNDIDSSDRSITATKAFIGIINDINQNQVTITINPGIKNAEINKHAMVSSDTEIEQVGTTSPDLEDLAIGDYIIAIGTTSDNETLNADRIITDDYDEPNVKRYVAYTTVTNVDEEEDTITLKDTLPMLEEPLDILATTDLLDALTKEDLDIDQISENNTSVALIAVNSSRETTSLLSLLVFTGTSSDPTPTTVSTCGDNICQDSVCQGEGCPLPESPETCPADCTQ